MPRAKRANRNMIAPVGCSLQTPEHSSLGRAELTSGFHPYRNTWQHMQQQQDSNLFWLKNLPVIVTSLPQSTAAFQTGIPRTDPRGKGGPKMMKSTPIGAFSLYLLPILGARRLLQPCYYSELNSASEMRFVLKMDRSAGVLHCYQFLFPQRAVQKHLYVPAGFFRSFCEKSWFI